MDRRRLATWRGTRATVVKTIGATLALCVSLVPALVRAPAASAGPPAAAATPIPPTLSWRNIGPQRAGRSIAVAGSTARPKEYYAGATGGGVWKTSDGGTSWAPVTDHQMTSSSVGAVAVCPANPDVVYAGTGEVDLRGDIIPGDGMYRTADGGKTWAHDGLPDSQTVSRIRIDPTDCNRAYAAVLGHPFGKNTQRGVFRTTDGGKTWQRVLFTDDMTGAADIELDPSDANVLYASMWRGFRTPWSLNSGGGPGDGLYKSTDGGSTWKNLSTAPGMPTAPLGKIGISVSAAQPGLVWALIEARGDAEGLYRSTDGGASWKEVNNDANLHQRPFYFTHVTADPKNPATVYVQNVAFMKSTDNGQTFSRIRGVHSDNHDLWIDPTNPQRMIEGNDGGANVTVDGGSTWTKSAYSSAQFYHVATTPSPDGTPYLVCGAQQDSSTVCMPSDGDGSNFFDIGGGEAGWAAVDQQDANIFYSGSYGGYLAHYDRRLGENQIRDVNPWPDNPMGHPASELAQRFQWTFPIITSPADPSAVYAGSQYVLRSTNQGQSWKQISPDLTRHDPVTLGDSGGPINLDQTSIEYFATVFSVGPSPIDKQVIWTGSDDGLVHVTTDMGENWTDVTPPGAPHFARFTMLEPSSHDTQTAYAAAQNYRLDDFGVYLYKTHDGGKHWTKIINGIPDGSFAWTIRQDPVKANLLYAGTQHGAYVSFDDGANWQPLALNMPDVSVQDLNVHGDDLVAATHGRGFYILHGLDQLRQLASGSSDTPPTSPAKPLSPPLIPPGPRHVSKISELLAAADDSPAEENAGDDSGDTPPEPPSTNDPVSNQQATLSRPDDVTRSVDQGADVTYKINQAATSVSMTFLDHSGHPIRTFTGLPASVGSHNFEWDLTYPGPVSFPGLIMWAADPNVGPIAPLGAYQVRLTIDGKTLQQPFAIKKDPRLTQVSAADIEAEFRLGTRIVQSTSDANQAVIDTGKCTSQIDARVAQTDDSRIAASGKALDGKLNTVSAALNQPLIKAGEDPLKYPIRLNNKIDSLLFVIESADSRPTDQAYAVFQLLDGQLRTQLHQLHQAVTSDVASFNKQLADAGLAPISCSG
jgi:photosystem II stability/assembly factor-like uncharacterized protein